MQQNIKLTIKKPSILFLTFFGTGFTPIAPGTAGALATLPFLYVIAKLHLGLYIELTILAALTLLASVVAQSVQKKYSVHDPSWIVIDEVIGVMATWIFRSSDSLLHLFIILILFRVFDIAKIWPASYFDRKIQHGFGTIADDLVSGVYAGVLYLILIYFFNI